MELEPTTSNYAKACQQYFINAAQSQTSLFAKLPENDQLLTETLIPAELQISKSMADEIAPALLTENSQLKSNEAPWLYKREPAASMKVFTKVMLHVWRQRREEVRRLKHIVDQLQRSSMKAKNQLHVYSTLMSVEQKRNSELQLRLKQSELNITEVRSSCDSLATSILNLSADNASLKQDIIFRKNEYQALESIANHTKENLFSTLLENHSLKNELSREQRNVRHLQRDNEQLLNEVMKIRTIDNDYKEVEQKLKTELQQKDEMLADLHKTVDQIQQQLSDSVNKNNLLEELLEKENLLKQKINELCEQLGIMQSGCNLADVNMIGSKVVAKNNANLPKTTQIIWQNFCSYSANIAYLFWLNLMPTSMSLSNYRYPIPNNAMSAAIALPTGN